MKQPKKLGVHPDTLRKWEKEGFIKSRKVGAHRRYTLEQINEIKKKGLVTDTPKKGKKGKDYSSYTKEELENELKLLQKQKKYGLVWEDKKEDIVEKCKTHAPILKSVPNMNVKRQKRRTESYIN